MEKNINTSSTSSNSSNSTRNASFSDGGIIGGFYLVSILMMLVVFIGVLVEFFTSSEVSEESTRFVLITVGNYWFFSYLYNQKIKEKKEKEEKEEQEGTVVSKKKIIVHDPKDDRYIFLVFLFSSIFFIGYGIYLSLFDFFDFVGVLLCCFVWIVGVLLFLAAIFFEVEYIAEIKPEFRKKLPQWWQKRIEDILKPKEEISLEEEIIKLKERLLEKLS